MTFFFLICDAIELTKSVTIQTYEHHKILKTASVCNPAAHYAVITSVDLLKENMNIKHPRKKTFFLSVSVICTCMSLCYFLLFDWSDCA